MKRTTVILVLVLSLLAGGSLYADKKIKARKGQTTQEFVNASGEAAHGLMVNLSVKAIVVTDDKDQAGPFRDLSGNDTQTIRMTNPVEAIENGGKLELKFQSYTPKIKVVAWTWLDERGKKLGKKIKNK